jgi:hypothetical protein
MNDQANNVTQNAAESQIIDEGLQVRIRMLTMKQTRFRFLDQPYLAKKLHRSQTAISQALAGKRRELLARITRHLDYLERRYGEKITA